MLVGEFVANPSGNMRAVAESGEPLPIELYRKPHTTLVPTKLWERAQAALERETAREQQKQRAETV